MKTSIIIPFAALALLASCSSKTSSSSKNEAESKASDNSALAIDSSDWKLTNYNIGDEPVSVADSEEAYTLSFLPEDNMFVMTTGCNDISGEYAIDGNTIKFTNTKQTMMSCPDMSIEMAFGPWFETATTYTVTPDSVLTITNEAGQGATFKAVPATANSDTTTSAQTE